MRLFPRLRGNKARDDDSIGSAISTKDQFDILVPIKAEQDGAQSGWNFLDRSDDSTVSSITTDELRFLGGKLTTTSVASKSSWCCCTNAGTVNTADETENTLVYRDEHRTPPPALSQTDNPWICCSNNAEAVEPKPRSGRSVSGQSLNRNNSLFDVLSEEEEQATHGGMKRIRRGIRRALPWSRNKQLSRREMEYMQAQE